MVLPRLSALLLPLLLIGHTASGTDPAVLASRALRIAPEVRARIGDKVWDNECSRSLKDLLDWNDGEPCASLGIGHFIWYPTPAKGPFDESFPPLLRFIQSQGGPLPPWLTPDSLCPWPDFKTFKATEATDPRAQELRAFLKDTIPQQAEFLAYRCAEALGKMLLACSPDQRDPIRAAFAALASTDDGLYCLTDYANFKGEGVKLEERYHDQGWGLMQVLLEVKRPLGSPAQVTADFSEAAKRVLTRRVGNSDPKKGEKRWLEGWLSRCDTYKKGI